MVGCNFHSEVQLIGGSECSKDRLESSIYWKRIQMYLGFGVHRCRPGRIIIIIDVMQGSGICAILRSRIGESGEFWEKVRESE